MTRRIDLLFFDAASGHRAAANALRAGLLRIDPALDVRLVDAVDCFADHPRLGRILRDSVTQFNRELQEERVFDLRGKVNLTLLAMDLVGRPGLDAIAGWWRTHGTPDLLVSVTPMYNDVLFRAARLVAPNLRCVTLPVDFEEFKRRYWFGGKTPQDYLLCTDRLVEQARDARVPEERIHAVRGMIIDPAFHDEDPVDRDALLRDGGMDPTRPLVMAHFGGQGSVLCGDLADAAIRAELPANLLVLCGRNPRHLDRVRALRAPFPLVARGFTEEPPSRWLRAADVLVGKGGAMTIVEAVVAGTPIVVIRSRGMLVQRGNEAWVESTGCGIVVDDANAAVAAVRTILRDPGPWRERVRAQQHRGIHDACRVLRAMLP